MRDACEADATDGSPPGDRGGGVAVGDAFPAFASAVSRDLRRMCWALTGDREMGEDLAQVTLEKVWRRWDRIEGDRFAYARRVAINESVSWKRRRAWRSETPTSVEGGIATSAIEPAVDHGAVRVDIERWLSALTAKHRAVIVLRFLLDLSVEETATLLNCSTGTVKSRTSRALDQLRARLDQPQHPSRETGADR